MGKQEKIEAAKGPDVGIFDQKFWKVVAQGLTLFVLTCLLSGGGWYINYALAEDKEQTTLTEGQAEGIAQRAILTDVLVELREIAKTNGDNIGNLKRKDLYRDCMDKEKDANACVHVLFKEVPK